ncbi:hypothetical protein WA026_019509 [Henosepilachna vigintioctopunctata]|uniref:Uncharacterized protein n=1 Tax=Henosepilachna vigintioctopunctata TaxID=420089 RepID=A0AAW1TVJ6_9CUCU
MRQLRGKSVSHEISYFICDNNILTNKEDTVEKFADIYESNSSNSNYGKEFLNHKINEELKPHIEENNEEHTLNLKITYEELVETIRQTPDSSPGHDNLPYAFIRNLPDPGQATTIVFVSIEKTYYKTTLSIAFGNNGKIKI